MNTNAVPKTHKVRKGIASVIMNLILIIFSLSCIFPIVWMAYSSLKEKRVFNADIMGLPKNPTLINYIKILSNKDYHLGQSMMNSVRTTLISIVLIIVFSFIVGYILARVHFKLNRILYVMFLMGMLVFVPAALIQGRGQMAELFLPALRSGAFWGSVWFLGAVSSVGAYGLLNFANGTLTNSEASLIGNIGTVVSVLAGVLLLHDPFTPVQAVGVVVILVFVTLANLPKKMK